MITGSSLDLLQLQSKIRNSYCSLEHTVLPPDSPPPLQLKQSLLMLQEDIKNLLIFAKHLQTFGEKSYEAATVANNKLEGVSECISILQKKLQDKQDEVVDLKQQIFDREREIEKLKYVKKIDASSITSVQFGVNELSVGYENQSSASTECEEKFPSYHSQEISAPKKREERIENHYLDESPTSTKLIAKLQSLAIHELEIENGIEN